jgi:hypothetical protein
MLRLQENDLKGLTMRFHGGSVAWAENVVWRDVDAGRKATEERGSG